jgi:hypothetical protein
LPETIKSSRYVAMASTSINGHTQLESGGLLVAGGTGKFLEGNDTSLFIDAGPDDDVLVDQDIVNSVLLEFEQAVTNGKQAPFLIPDVLLDRLHLQPLDTYVKQTVNKGHFQEITRAPYLSIRLAVLSAIPNAITGTPGNATEESECPNTIPSSMAVMVSWRLPNAFTILARG